jgi:diguanylate cyclase (GGDEF)-like protein/PAS domain S-box-containing protein
MKFSLPFDDPLIHEALTDTRRSVALLGELSGKVELLSASPGFRDNLKTATRMERIAQVFSADIVTSLCQAVRTQSGWAASCWAVGASHWTLMQLWPFHGMGLLFLHTSEPARAKSSHNAESMYHLMQDPRGRDIKQPDLVVTTSLTGGITQVNQGFAQLFQAPRARFAGAALDQWVCAQDAGLYRAMLNRVGASDDKVDGEFRLRSPRNHLYQYHWVAVRSHDSVCWMATAQTTSLADALVKTEAHLHLILENIEDGFLSLDGDWNLSFLNMKAAQTFRRSVDQLLGKNLWSELPELERTPFRAQLFRAVSTQTTHAFEWLDDGTWHLVRCFPGKEGVSLFLSDITQIKNSEEQARHLALHDSLTGLPNRECARIELEKAIDLARRQDKRVAVLFMDLDGFKKVNDTRGHEIGDELLKLVAQRLSNTVRQTDLVARQSGDEFLMILPNVQDAQAAMQVGQKVVRTIGQDPFVIHADKVHVGASVGISIYPDNGTDPLTLMKYADMAMYHIKQRSKNAVALFEDSMADGIQRKALVEKLIRETLERKTLQVHYQPRFCTRTGRVLALEALARLRDAQGRLISPADFIGVAEETRLIAPLSLDVMTQAGHFIRQFNASNDSSIHVSVNISVKHLQTGDLAEQVSTVLTECGMKPEWLELEIPESVLAMNIKSLRQQCDDLHALGVSTVIDNVGISATHLTALSDVKPVAVKFDRSLIKRTPDDRQAASLVEALHLAYQRMGVSTVAEGVESEAQKRFLTDMGFAALQGYALAIPMTDRDISQFLSQHPLMQVATANSARSES